MSFFLILSALFCLSNAENWYLRYKTGYKLKYFGVGYVLVDKNNSISIDLDVCNYSIDDEYLFIVRHALDEEEFKISYTGNIEYYAIDFIKNKIYNFRSYQEVLFFASSKELNVNIDSIYYENKRSC
ncbi:hypothetical protein [Pasteurella testudinis]|uniref:hypothetical protein n=1 Tax=Pasteurella testudinis TaxID=761 RepID=UPI004058CDD9